MPSYQLHVNGESHSVDEAPSHGAPARRSHTSS